MNKSKLYEQVVNKKSNNIGIAKKIVGNIQKAMGGVATDEQAILDALNLITSIDIYNSVLQLVKKQPQTEFQHVDVYNKTSWNKINGKGWQTVMQWIQITDFEPLIGDDTNWLSKYSKILKKFNANEVVGTIKLSGSNKGGVYDVAADSIGFADGNAWDDPNVRHNVAVIGQIATTFIPIIGPIVSAGIGLANAKQYYDEGKKYEAGLETMFSLLPGGSKLAKGLVKKIVSKSGVLTKLEREFLTRVAMSKDLIVSKINNLLTKGIESGTINPSAIKSLKWVRPAGQGVVNVGYGVTKNIVVPTAIYTKAYALTLPSVDEFIRNLQQKNYEYIMKLLKRK